MTGRICGKRSNRMPSPSPTTAIISAKPRTTPTRWGRVGPNPYFTPDVINIRLFGPGVIEATNANALSAQKISGWMIGCKASSGGRLPRSERGRFLVAPVVLARAAGPASPRGAAGIEGRLRERGERARQRADAIDAGGRPLAPCEHAVQFRHGLGQRGVVVVEPDLDHASPGER